MPSSCYNLYWSTGLAYLLTHGCTRYTCHKEHLSELQLQSFQFRLQDCIINDITSYNKYITPIHLIDHPSNNVRFFIVNVKVEQGKYTRT